MKGLLKGVLTVFLAVFLCNSAHAGSLLSDLAAASQSIRLLSASFVQEKRMSVLTRPLVSEGIFCLAREGGDDAVLWLYTKPLPTGFQYRKGHGELLDAAGRARRASVEEETIIRAVVQNVRAWIHVQPEVLHTRYVITEEPPDTLLLRPRHRSFFAAMRVQTDSARRHLRSLSFEESNGDTLDLTFSDTRVNGDLPNVCARIAPNMRESP
ncbi:MAG: outer membrane lipoprotein carrier protein LolA [Desulfovibrionaceae bacterium]|nr:outer membrane lipoprotein carrier protein LolA [Desulfovibrionaceae bacterium]